MASRVSCIENSEKNTLKAFLVRENEKLIGIDWASAFVTSQGIQKILRVLERTAIGKRKIRILVGLYQWFTEPKALRELLSARQRLGATFEVRISRTKRFHWKYYLLRERENSTFVIGSSNLTSDGLSTEGELNAVIRCKNGSSELWQFEQTFNEQWDNAAPLTSKIISNYSSHRPTDASTSYPAIPLNEILGHRKQSNNVISEPQKERRHFRRPSQGYFSAKTNKLIDENVSDAERYWWLVNVSNHGRGDRGILFDFDERRIYAIEIVKTTTLPSNTPDGRKFMAYKRIAKIAAPHMTKERRSLLRESGLVNSWVDAGKFRSLSKAKFDSFLTALKKKV